MQKTRLRKLIFGLVFLFLFTIILNSINTKVFAATTTTTTQTTSTPTTSSSLTNLNLGPTIPQKSDIFTGNITGAGDIFDSPADIVAFAFKLVISISGAIFILMLLFGGVTYLTSAGNEEGTGKAKKLLIDAVIGLVIVLVSFAVGTWLLAQFGLSSSANTGTNSNTPTTGTNGQLPSTNTPTNTLPTFNFSFISNSGSPVQAKTATLDGTPILFGQPTSAFSSTLSNPTSRLLVVEADGYKHCQQRWDFSQTTNKSIQVTLFPTTSSSECYITASR